MEQPSVLEDTIKDRDIEDRYNEAHIEDEEPIHWGENVQSNIDSQSYGEHSVTNDSDNVRKEYDDEINKARSILQQTDEIMRRRS